MKNFIKKHKKLIIMSFVLLFLVGCKSVIDPKTNEVIEKYVISLGDKFPWGKDGYGWFDIFIVYPFAQMFNFVASKLGAFWSIVIVTAAIELAKLPSTIKSTVQQQKMTELQPHIARIQEKYRGRDDQQAKMQEAQEIQNLYKKHDVSMFGSIAPLFLQLPVILAVFQAVQRAELIIHGSVLGQPFNGTPQIGIQTGNKVYIAIFIVMIISQAVSMFVPQYLQKQKTKNRNTGAPQGPNTNNMMMISLLMIVFIAFRWNIGMSIYWAVSALSRLVSMVYVHYFHSDK